MASVDDVVLLNVHRALARRCSVSGPRLRKVSSRLGLPALEDVDTAGVDQVRADRDVEAANCPASLFDDAHTAAR
jgi:hypothetical protein